MTLYIVFVCAQTRTRQNVLTLKESIWQAQPTSKTKIYLWLDGVRRED